MPSVFWYVLVWSLGRLFSGTNCPKWPVFWVKMLVLISATAPAPTAGRVQNKNLAYLVSRHGGNKKIGSRPENMELWPKNTAFLARKSVFSTLLPYNPFFCPRTDPAQCDHIFPIFSGNSGCLRFSGRCRFGCLASHLLAPIAQNGPFCG